jgi:hypothetical protein
MESEKTLLGRVSVANYTDAYAAELSFRKT